jgi:hypothetical protein
VSTKIKIWTFLFPERHHRLQSARVAATTRESACIWLADELATTDSFILEFTGEAIIHARVDPSGVIYRKFKDGSLEYGSSHPKVTG